MDGDDMVNDAEVNALLATMEPPTTTPQASSASSSSSSSSSSSASASLFDVNAPPAKPLGNGTGAKKAGAKVTGKRKAPSAVVASSASMTDDGDDADDHPTADAGTDEGDGDKEMVAPKPAVSSTTKKVAAAKKKAAATSSSSTASSPATDQPPAKKARHAANGPGASKENGVGESKAVAPSLAPEDMDEALLENKRKQNAANKVAQPKAVAAGKKKKAAAAPKAKATTTASTSSTTKSDATPMTKGDATTATSAPPSTTSSTTFALVRLATAGTTLAVGDLLFRKPGVGKTIDEKNPMGKVIIVPARTIKVTADFDLGKCTTQPVLVEQLKRYPAAERREYVGRMTHPSGCTDYVQLDYVMGESIKGGMPEIRLLGNAALEAVYPALSEAEQTRVDKARNRGPGGVPLSPDRLWFMKHFKQAGYTYKVGDAAIDGAVESVPSCPQTTETKSESKESKTSCSSSTSSAATSKAVSATEQTSFTAMLDSNCPVTFKKYLAFHARAVAGVLGSK